MKQLFILTLFTLSFMALHAQSRMGVDSTFGNNGNVLYGPASWDGVGALLQADGKMVIYGNDPEFSTQYFDQDLRMTRLNADGTIDSSFNQTGIVYEHEAFDHYFMVSKGVLLSNGKILMGGDGAPVDGGKHTSTIGRYNADGSVDSLFGNNGWVRQEFDSLWANTRDMIVTEDSKILVLVQASFYNDSVYFEKNYLYRLSEEGQLDASFGVNGIQEVIDTNFFYLSRLAVASTGVISILGNQYDDDGYPHAALYTLEPDGSQDSVARIQLPAPLQLDDYLNISSIVIQPDDKLLLAGSANSEALLLRLNANGTYDKSFSHDGVVLQGNIFQFQYIRDLILLENEKLLVNYGGFSMGLHNKNGTGDYGFSINGLYEGPRPSGWTGEGSNTGAFALLPLPNGKIVQVAIVTNKLYATRYEQKSCAQ